MALPDLDVGRVQRWCAARVPEHARHQVRVECQVAPRHLTIVERRAPWREDFGREWTSFPIARLRYTAAGQCVRQKSEQAPIQWTSQLAEPYTLLGDLSWTNYTVSSDVMLEKERLRTAHRPCVHLPVPGTGQRQRPLPAGDPDRVMVDYEQ